MIKERQMQTGRGHMSWLEAGAGWPVILLHAFPLRAEMWRAQLEHVPPDWRFIAPDFRGFGGSRAVTLPPEGGSDGASVDDYAADIGDLMDCLELDDAVIAGLSMGGYVAFAMYRQAPARFNGLILADTRPQADTPAGREARTRMREQLARGGTAAVADEMLPKLLSPQAPIENAELVRRVRGMIEGADVAGVDAAIGALMSRPDSTPDLTRISCATLVLVGEHDGITPAADAEAMQRAIPRSTMTVVPGAGHLSNLERPDTFTRVLADFLLARL
jgi:pimeloyl-ACP methyl ester carboxylesterase